MNKEQLEKIVEQIKASMSVEELDELERQYNEMYFKLKTEQRNSGSLQNEE